MTEKHSSLLIKLLGGGLLSLLCLLSSPTFAESPITFLGVETDIIDRDARGNKTLSGILESITEHCETKASNAKINARTPEKEAKKRLRVQVRCLLDKVRNLRKPSRHSSHRGKHQGHNKHKLITNSEKKALIAIIRQFKANGGIITQPPVEPPVETVKSVVNGRVTTPSGSVVSGVSITAGADQTVLAVTDANGNFSVMLEANLEYAIQLSADGYATQVVPVQSPKEDGTINLDFTMIARGAVQTFAATSGGSITGADGATVTVTPNSFVDVNGDLVTGDIELTITPVDVSNPATLGAFPGEFVGIQTDLTETPIISLGTVEYKFTQNGEEVQLDASSSATAEILIPIYIPTYQDGSDIQAGDVIPLWSLNEVTGIWEQEGTGTVVASTSSPTGLAMQATVSHFTWWNCDVTMNAAKANITVSGSSAGTANIQATVSNCNIGWRPTTVETVINIGETASNLDIPSACNVCYSAELTLNSGEIATTDTQCATTEANGTIDIRLQEPNQGPLNLTANASEGPVSFNGFVDYPMDKIQLRSTTAEDSISYSVTSAQSLPAGLSLNTISASQAEITGIPTEAGEFSIEVQGVDATGAETDTVTINFSIVDLSTSNKPVFVNDSIYFELLESFDLAPYNVAEPATSWSLEAQVDGSPVPTWFTINDQGVVSVAGDLPVYDSWQGVVTATNAAGSTSTNVDICTGDCSSFPTPIPGDYEILLVPSYSVSEGASQVSVQIHVNQNVLEDVTFDFRTSGDTASPNQDYTHVSGTITIPAGSNSAAIIVPLIDDNIEESREDFYVSVSNLSTGTFIYNNSRITIYDDDGIAVAAQ